MIPIILRSLQHLWNYALMALVIFQIPEFAYSKPLKTEPLSGICDADFESAVASVCLERGFALEKDPTQASICCTEGCPYSALSVFCNRPPKPNRPRYIFCDSVYYKAINSLCNDGFDQTKDPNLPLNCCTKGCSLFELGNVCKKPPTPTQSPFIFCGADFYTALDSLCRTTYDLSKNSNLASQCCSPGCALSELESVCINRKQKRLEA